MGNFAENVNLGKRVLLPEGQLVLDLCQLVEWSPRFSDFISLEIFLWGHLKAWMYAVVVAPDFARDPEGKIQNMVKPVANFGHFYSTDVEDVGLLSFCPTKCT